jgi:hypothetical protein
LITARADFVDDAAALDADELVRAERIRAARREAVSSWQT